MEEPDEVHHQNRALRIRDRIGESPLGPVIGSVLALLSPTKRFQDFPAEPDTIDTVPVSGSTMGPLRIKEVITANPDAPRHTRNEPRG